MTKIQRLYLKNHAFIYKVMGLYEIEINRTNNPLCIIIGANGSCKSTILSELTPIPLERTNYRNTNRFLEKKTGIKELDILLDNRYLYKIHIEFTDTKTTCYIHKYEGNKDLGELNPNGNVRTYMEILENELGFSSNYINIGYLSTAITSIINMKSTERNNYISEWISYLSEYIDAFSIAQKQFNVLKKQIDLLNNEISNLSLINYKIEIDHFNNQYNSIELEYNEIIKNINKGETYLSLYKFYERYEISENISAFLNKVEDLKKERISIQNTLTEIIPYLGNDKNNKIKIELEQINSKIKFNNDKLEDLKKTIINNQLLLEEYKKDTNDFNYNTYQDTILDIKYYETELIKYNNNKSEILKEFPLFKDFDNFLIENSKIDHLCNLIEMLYNDYNKITNIIDIKILTNENVITSLITSLDNNFTKYNEYIKTIDNEINIINTRLYALNNSTINENLLKLKPVDCNKKCSLVDEIIKYVYPEKEINDLKHKLPNLILEKSNYTTKIEDIQKEKQKIQLAHEYILNINSILLKQKELFIDLPNFIQKIFIDPDIYKILSNIPNILNMSEKWQEYIYLNNLIINKTSLLKNIKEKENILKLKNTIYIKQKELILNTENINTNKEKILNEIENDINKIEQLKKIDKIVSFTIEQINNYNNKCDLLLKEKKLIKNMISNYYITSSIKYKLQLYDTEKINKKIVLNELQERLTNLKLEEAKMNSLLETRDKLIYKQKKLNIMMLVWSPKSGYPALEINNFLDNLTIQTNKDLDNMWDSKLRIHEFLITPNEFTISIDREGDIIKDVSELSEGEKATMTLAISFALIEIKLNTNRYNTIRIDEITGPLDNNRKLSFIEMINKRLAELDCVDCYIITHDSLLIDDIDADMIILKGAFKNDFNLTNKDIIFNIE
jgi:DNA repair exonuclease SbcCD ATPase subunit